MPSLQTMLLFMATALALNVTPGLGSHQAASAIARLIRDR
jgi:hypothetical protein